MPSQTSHHASLQSNVDEVIEQIANLARSGKLQDFGSFTTTIYDTAWVSMVHRIVDGQTYWLYPRCFDHLLEQQQPDGAWPSYATTVDGILNTAAGLLSLLLHRTSNDSFSLDKGLLKARIRLAEQGLRHLLQQWDVQTTVHVGFEILVPSLLRQIHQHGIYFDFAGKSRLQQLWDQKLQKFRPEMVYSTKQTTLLHSLEGLIGQIDFNRVKHHCSAATGILGSPAATAAYLMNCNTWDDDAESYLTRAVSSSGGEAVPSAFPTYIFEISWGLSFILDESILENAPSSNDANTLMSFFTRILNQQEGVVGFAEGILEDADDTARTLLMLKRLGIQHDCEPMIKKFQSEGHFKTYELEGRPSFSANCNIALALLEADEPDEHFSQIQVLINFLLSRWEDGTARDKWNISPHYIAMLFSDVCVRLLVKHDRGALPNLPKSIVRRLPAAVCQLLMEMLAAQQVSGDWGGSIESTSYAVMTLAQCLRLPWSYSLRQTLTQSFERGRNYLTAHEQGFTNNEYLWVEKVTYASPFLRSIYWLSALHVQSEEFQWSETVMKAFTAQGRYAEKIRYLFTKLPSLQRRSLQHIDLALVQAASFVHRLQEARSKVFPIDDMPMTVNTYLEYGPILWTTANQVGQQVLPLSLMWEMLSLSMLNHQFDEYMDSVAATLSGAGNRLLMSTIAATCGVTNGTAEQSHWFEPTPSYIVPVMVNPALQASGKQWQQVTSVLHRFVKYITSHPSIIASTQLSQSQLKHELYNFIVASIIQKVTNHRLKNRHRGSPRTRTLALTTKHNTYLDWVRTFGADSTSCPMSFQFFMCLVESYIASRKSSQANNHPRARYTLDTLARDLAVMSRQYNDMDTRQGDHSKGDLSSLDFPIFHRNAHHATGSADPAEDARLQLMRMADQERGRVEYGLEKLKNTDLVSDRTSRQIQVFVDVAEILGEIKVVKSTASRADQGI